VLGGPRLRKGDGLVDVAGQTHRAGGVEALPRDGVGGGHECGVDGGGQGVGEALRRRHHRGDGAGVVLGLGDEIERDEPGQPRHVDVTDTVLEDEHLRRTGEEVDADAAGDGALGGGDIRVARSADLVDARYRMGAIRKRRHRLRAAHREDVGDAGDATGRGDGRRDEVTALLRRRRHTDPPHAGDNGRQRRHQHGRRIGRATARHIEADDVEGVHPLLEPAALEHEATRPLRGVKRADAICRLLQRPPHRRVTAIGEG
jgi:hypothetical protein